MDEEILGALTQANAVDQESGLTIEKLLEVTGRNLDTVVMNVQRLRRDGKAQVSNADMLSRNFRDVWPNVTGRDVTGEDVAKAVKDEKERNLLPIVVWLGSVVLKEREEKRMTDELRSALLAAATRDTVVVHGPNTGQIAVGDGNQQAQQEGDHSSSPQKYKNVNTENRTNKKRSKTLGILAGIAITSLATYIGGKLLEWF